MANLRTFRKRIIAVVVLLLLLDVAAIALLLSPIGRSREARIQEYDRVRNELQAKRRDALPARDMDQKLGTARTQIIDFENERLPERYSQVTDVLGKLAQDAHVRLGGVKYDAAEADVPSLQRLQIEAQVTGNYADLMRFVNGLERDKMLFIVNGVSLGEAQGGNIRLEMKLETYLKTGQKT